MGNKKNKRDIIITLFELVDITATFIQQVNEKLSKYEPDKEEHSIPIESFGSEELPINNLRDKLVKYENYVRQQDTKQGWPTPEQIIDRFLSHDSKD